MHFIIGWLILLPFAGAFWLTWKIMDACIKKGGLMRLVGALVCLSVGGFSTVAGWQIGPIVGWFIMVCGGFLGIFGTWRVLTATKEEVELEELTEKLDKERKEREQRDAKEIAKEILELGVIDDFELVDWICNILDKIKFDNEAFNLSWGLKELKKKQSKSLH